MAVKTKHTMEELDNLAQTLYYAKHAKFLFYFYAFVSFVFWFLNCFEVEGLYYFNGLFIIPYKIVKLFYSVDGVSVDFSLAIIGFISLVLGIVYEYFTNKYYMNVLDEQDKLERELQQRRLQKKKNMAKPQVGVTSVNNAKATFEDSKLLYIIQPHIKKIKRKQNDLELTFQEVEIWKQRINKKIIENINYSKPMQKGYYRKNLFVMYKDFYYVDDFVYYITPTLDSIILEFRKYGINTYFNSVISALTNTSNLEKELDCMDTILSLNFKKEIIVTNRFKISYDNKPIHKYKTVFKGEYNLSKNLSVSNKQPLYSLIDEDDIGD
jgi:hypothetical protein